MTTLSIATAVAHRNRIAAQVRAAIVLLAHGTHAEQREAALVLAVHAVGADAERGWDWLRQHEPNGWERLWRDVEDDRLEREAEAWDSANDGERWDGLS